MLGADVQNSVAVWLGSQGWSRHHSMEAKTTTK